MKKIVLIKYFVLITCFMLASCEKYNNNPAINQGNTDTSVDARIIGIWKLPDKSGDPEKALNYMFDANKLCNIYRGTEELDLNPHTMRYQLFKNKDNYTVFITDDKNRKTIFRILSIDESNMKVVFEMIENIRQSVYKELSFTKNNQQMGY